VLPRGGAELVTSIGLFTVLLWYPFSTAVLLVGSVAFLIAAVAEDPRSGLIAAVFLAACALRIR